MLIGLITAFLLGSEGWTLPNTLGIFKVPETLFGFSFYSSTFLIGNWLSLVSVLLIRTGCGSLSLPDTLAAYIFPFLVEKSFFVSSDCIGFIAVNGLGLTLAYTVFLIGSGAYSPPPNTLGIFKLPGLNFYLGASQSNGTSTF